MNPLSSPDLPASHGSDPASSASNSASSTSDPASSARDPASSAGDPAHGLASIGPPAPRTGPSPDPSDQDQTIAISIRTSIQRLVKVLRKHTRNSEMLSLTERSTLGWLYQQGKMLPTELAQLEKVTAQSMSQVVSHLFEIGMIQKTPSSEDKRKTYLSLTDNGRTWLEQARREKQEWLARIIHEKVTEKEKEVLAAAAAILGRLADE